MKKTSLAEAKAHLSTLVDDAEHRRRPTLILRHGKPAAAIVPVEVALEPQRRLSQAEIDELLGAFKSTADGPSAVEDLLVGRR